MTHVLAGHPKWRQHLQREEALRVAEQLSRERIEAQSRPYREAKAQWDVRSKEAVLAGKEPPKEPQPPNLGADADSAHLFMQARQRLAEEGRALLAEIAQEVELAAAKEEGRLIAEAKPHIQALARNLEDRRELLEAVRRVRSAVDGQGPERHFPSLADRTRTEIGLADLLGLLPLLELLPIEAFLNRDRISARVS